MKSVYEFIVQQKSLGKKILAVLIDPDNTNHLSEILNLSKENLPDIFLVGGSLLSKKNIEHCIQTIKSSSEIPVLLFPGNEMQISADADGILLLSLISGRNPELLIGRHVAAAGILQASDLEIIPTGYILIESGGSTAVSYISNTQPIPKSKYSIAAMTALAGEQLGMKLIYLEGGSGAQFPVTAELISTVRKHISIPIFTGGGIRTVDEIKERLVAGADVVVIGNILEEHPELLPSFCKAVHSI